MIRMSGPSAFRIARRHVSPWPDEDRRAVLCSVTDGDGEVLDQALVTIFASPFSFTGEDVVEIATHGGRMVPALVLAALVSSGARMALAGEFTRRAVLNGKIDIVQAEAIGDLIDSTSRAMQRMAVTQLDGGLSKRIEKLRDQVTGLEALIAYDIDFPEEDDGPIARARVEQSANEVLLSLDGLLATVPAGELIRAGALVVIAGPPNAGKSSLFNAVLGRSRAIVTEIPGTTRDAIEAVLDSGTWPLRLVDTAGLRDTSDVVERVGIEVAKDYLASADVILACGETPEDVQRTHDMVTRSSAAPIIGVLTKGDMRESLSADGDIQPTSAVSGAGVRELLDRIAGTISEQYGSVGLAMPVLTRERQRYCVEHARTEMLEFTGALADFRLPVSLAAIHLRSATSALADVTGTIDVEDVLDRLFSTFCVGK